MTLRFRLILAFISFSVAIASAITGRVVGKESGLPLEFVTVVAYNADSLYLGGCTTDSLGRFDIAKPGARTVNLMLMGYKTLTVGVNAQSDVIGDVMMEQDAVQLGEVTVTDVRPETRLQGNSFITTVSNTFLSTLVSASDMLKWIPGLTVNDRQIKVFQKSNPLIYINSRRITDFNEIDMLEPTNIASVEVIPNPGVKYGVGVDCVVIIRTKKNLSDKLGMSFLTNNQLSTYYSNSEILNFTLRNKGLEINVNGFLQLQHKQFVNELEYEAYSSNPWTRDFSQTVNSKPHGGGVTVGISYDFSPTQSVGVRNSFSAYKLTSGMTSTNNMTVAGKEFEKRLTTGENNEKESPLNALNIYYNGTFGRLNIDFNADWYTSESNINSKTFEQSSKQPDYEVNTTSENSTSLLAEKLVATLDLKWMEIMFGEEFTHTRYESTFANPEGIVADNSAVSRENTIAIFAEISKNFKILSASAGIRYEHADAKYSYTETYTEKESRKLDNWFPSVGLTGTFGGVSLSLRYDYRFFRPAYNQLNASMVYVDAYNLKQGNPLLKSEGQHNITLYASWKRLWCNIFYSSRKNPILTHYLLYGTEGYTLLRTYENFDTHKMFGANLGGNFTLGNWFCSGSVIYSRQWFSMPFQGKAKNLDGDRFGLVFNSRLSLPWELKFGVNYWIYSGFNSYNRYNGVTQSLSASLSKSFLNNALTVDFGCRDILNTSQGDFSTYENYMYVSGSNRNDSRYLYISLRYDFNAKQSRYKGKGAGNSEKSRL